MTATALAKLTAQVLAHYADELAAAGAEQLAHLAERAETLPKSPVGDRMRAMVAAEQQNRRVLAENPANLAEQDCSHRDDPGHDHDECLEHIARIRAAAAGGAR